METLFFFSAMIAFILFHLFFTLSRIRRIQVVLPDEERPQKKNIRVTVFVSLFIPVFILLVVLTGFLFPEGNKLCVEFVCMKKDWLKYTGLFFLKFSVVWVLVTGLQIEKLLSAAEETIDLKKAVKVERTSFIAVFLFCSGAFFFQPNLILMLTLLTAGYRLSAGWNTVPEAT